MSGVTKGFIVIILCKKGLDRNIARYLVQVHLKYYYWPPANIPLIRRDPGPHLSGCAILFGSNRVFTLAVYDSRTNTTRYTVYWRNNACSLCGRLTTQLVYTQYDVGSRVGVCIKCRDTLETGS